MKTTLYTAPPSQLETECLVVPVLDAAAESGNGDKSDKHKPQIQANDKAVLDAAADLIASGEVTGKMLEIALLHKPSGLKAKRLMLIGGGKAKNFSSYELRKLAGAAVRNLKAKGIKSFALVAPASSQGEADPASKSTYDKVAALFARAQGMGKGDHANRISTTRAANPTALYVPNSKSTTENDPYSAWDKQDFDVKSALPFLKLVHESGESRIYELLPRPAESNASQRGGMADAVKAIVEGAFVGNFDPDYYQSDRKEQKIEELVIVAPAADQKALQTAMEQGRIIGEAQNFTRDLVNEPGNRMTPTILAERAKKMCDETGLKCEVYGGEKIRELKMGAFWSVSQGSDEEPRLIVMRHEPAGAPEKPVLGLVGKGITFDSGGISIKPSDGMEKMKYDMAGGAAMIGAMRAIAQLKPNLRVIGIVCASENMPSGKAQKPGDVQIAMSGKSIEIINTDAEGRLVLADGLHYARQLGCTHLIDAATLTGACVVALGMINAGIFANDEDFYERFSKSLQKSGEKMWRLPVDEEYREMIKSSIADMVNSGGRWGGAVTAAMFLKEFVGDTPWLHLDIAGVAWMEESKPWIAKGPSGIAVRSLVEFVRDLAAGPLSKN